MPPITSTADLPRPDWLPQEALSVDAAGAVTCRVGSGSWKIMVAAMESGIRASKARAAARTDETGRRARAAQGIPEPAPVAAKAPAAPRASSGNSAASSSANVVRASDGTMTYRGQPVKSNAAGQPCVLADTGWLTVAEAERAGVTTEDLEWAAFTAKQGTGHLAAAHREGPR